MALCTLNLRVELPRWWRIYIEAVRVGYALGIVRDVPKAVSYLVARIKLRKI